MLASLGVGVYSSPNEIAFRSFLVNGGVIFAYKCRNNLDIGIGAGITNSYDVPIPIARETNNCQKRHHHFFLLSYLCCNFQITSSAKINFISTADYYKLPIFKDLYACNNSYRLSMQITQNHISVVSRRINDSWEHF